MTQQQLQALAALHHPASLADAAEIAEVIAYSTDCDYEAAYDAVLAAVQTH